MTATGPDAVEAVLELHRDLYALADVESAAAAFRGVADVEVQAGDPRHRVRIRPKGGGDAARLGHELGNYVLALAASRHAG